MVGGQNLTSYILHLKSYILYRLNVIWGHAISGVALQTPLRHQAIRSSFVQGIKPCPTEQLLSFVLPPSWRRASGYALRAKT